MKSAAPRLLPFYVPGASVWRSCSKDGRRLEFLQRWPLAARLFMLLFLPHFIMAFGLLCAGVAGMITYPFGLRLTPGLAFNLLGIVVGSIFTPFTAALQFGRSSVVLDRERSRVLQRSGLKLLPYVPLIPWSIPGSYNQKRQREFILRDVDAVRITRVEYLSSGRMICRVALVLKEGDPLDIAGCRDFGAARTLAEEISSFAAIPVDDQTRDAAIRRGPAELDLPLAERPDDSPREPRAPRNPDGRYEVAADRVAVHLPRPAFRPWRWLDALVISVLLCVAGRMLAHPPPEKPAFDVLAEAPLHHESAPDMWAWRLGTALYWIIEAMKHGGAAGAGLAAVILAFLLLVRRPAWTLEASSREVMLTGSTFGLRWRRSIPVGELEELRVDGAQRKGWIFTAVSDARLLRFGRGLSRGELEYIRALIRKAVAQAARPPSGAT